MLEWLDHEGNREGSTKNQLVKVRKQKEKGTYTFNSCSLFLGNTDGLGSWRKGCIVITTLTQKLKELLLVETNQLSELRIPGTDLLKDWLEHLRVLLDKLS